MTITRRQAREWAIQMLVTADIGRPDGTDDLIRNFWSQMESLDEEDGGGVVASGKMREFTEARVRGVLAHLDEIDAVLAPLLENWDLIRLGTVERAVLRLGCWEIRYSEVPKPVAVNEAVDLVNWYASPKSRSLINGVLDKIEKPEGLAEPPSARQAARAPAAKAEAAR